MSPMSATTCAVAVSSQQRGLGGKHFRAWMVASKRPFLSPKQLRHTQVLQFSPAEVARCRDALHARSGHLTGAGTGASEWDGREGAAQCTFYLADGLKCPCRMVGGWHWCGSNLLHADSVAECPTVA